MSLFTKISSLFKKKPVVNPEVKAVVLAPPMTFEQVKQEVIKPTVQPQRPPKKAAAVNGNKAIATKPVAKKPVAKKPAGKTDGSN